ncbi:MAG: hypothetical protein JWP09_447 [Candidatus Taylorbacteria bacterium]|nr:hypothetical protein [Candidatus Taylorbacteria bacterium]
MPTTCISLNSQDTIPGPEQKVTISVVKHDGTKFQQDFATPRRAKVSSFVSSMCGVTHNKFDAEFDESTRILVVTLPT